ncbi:MAG: AraC family transcriptional regulator [bacterium]
MKNGTTSHIPAAILQGLRQTLEGAFTSTVALHVAPSEQTTDLLRPGIHCHRNWELFIPLHGALQFKAVGHPALTIGAGTLLIVPPECLHMQTASLPQAKNLRLLNMYIGASHESSNALQLGLRGPRNWLSFALTAAETVAWTVLLSEPPESVMGKVAQALGQRSRWSRERAAGLLRVLISAYAEVVTTPRHGDHVPGERHVNAAIAFLHTHYFEPDLSLRQVSLAVGLSSSRLSHLFRQTTGQTLSQTVVDIRLRRALQMLAQSGYIIKEIAALTGWSSQLYFSAAFHKRYGTSPSAYRTQASTKRTLAQTGGLSE